MTRINMMAGKRDWGADWVNIDGQKLPHIWSEDITLCTFPPNTVDLVFCSHGIAYFSTDEVKILLKCWHHTMAPGATLRIATPDFAVLSEMFQQGIEWNRLKGPLYGEMNLNGNKIYHKTCYTEETLTALLTECGFINVERYNHWETEHPNTGDRNDFYDDQSAAYINGTLISLNVQCKKSL